MKKRILYTIIIAICLTSTLALFLIGGNYSRNRQTNTFYAVFLTNDQVYFGKIIEDTATTLTLQNVYYLKANAEIPQGEMRDSKAKLALIKLGEELHAPKDKLIINKDHMLFMEEMEAKGVIRDAINEYEQQNKTR